MASTVYRAGDTVAWSQLILPWRVAGSISRHRFLIGQFIKRDIQARYRGSVLGVFWSLLRPVAMLAVYVVVFGLILQPRLAQAANRSKLDFVLVLFSGLLLFDFFAETLCRSPTLVVSHPNYVKRVMFPLEILPVMAVGAAFVQMVIGFVPFFVVLAGLRGSIPLTALWLPVVTAPLILLGLGLSWFLSTLGVFLRDVNAIVPVGVTILLFASAIFYDLDEVPPDFQSLFLLNPIAVLVHEARNVALWGLSPAWLRLGAASVIGLAVALAGYAFFMRCKRGFAEVM